MSQFAASKMYTTCTCVSVRVSVRAHVEHRDIIMILKLSEWMNERNGRHSFEAVHLGWWNAAHSTQMRPVLPMHWTDQIAQSNHFYSLIKNDIHFIKLNWCVLRFFSRLHHTRLFKTAIEVQLQKLKLRHVQSSFSNVCALAQRTREITR